MLSVRRLKNDKRKGLLMVLKYLVGIDFGHGEMGERRVQNRPDFVQSEGSKPDRGSYNSFRLENRE